MKRTDELVAKVVADYTAGYTLDETGVRNGLQGETVRKWLYNAGVERRSTGTRPGRPHTAPKFPGRATFDHALALSLVAEGHSYAEVGRRVDPPVTREAIRNLVQRMSPKDATPT